MWMPKKSDEFSLILFRPSWSGPQTSRPDQRLDNRRMWRWHRILVRIHVRSVLLPFDNYEAYDDLCVSNDVMQSPIVALVFSRLDYGSATLAGLPKQLMERLQSVQNAAARLIFNACRQDHIQPLLRILHWLRMPERVAFRLAVLVSVSLPPWLCTRLPGFRSSARVTPQCTSTTALFDYISAGRSTHGAFYHWRPHLSSAAVSVWNSLPESVRSSPSLQVFRSRLKTELFARSYRHD